MVAPAASRLILLSARQVSPPSWPRRNSKFRSKTTSAEGAEAAPGERRLKTCDDLPGPSLLQTLFWLFAKGYVLRSHELQLVYKKKYGPIWKSKLGNYKNMNLASPDLVELLVRQEGKYPMRCDMALWKEHRDLRGFAYGPLTEEGERWYNLRSVLGKRMLKPVEAVRYTGVMNEVVSDLLLRLQQMRKWSPSGVMVNDIASVLYRFSFEGISAILFETRLGCLQERVPPETQAFIDSINYMLRNFVFASVLPTWTRSVLPFWKRYLDGWDTIFAFGKKLIDQKMDLLQARLEQGEEVEAEYLTYLLSSGKLTTKEICGSVAELLLAGVDTTSNTLSWTFYHLAKDMEVQNALYLEVSHVVPGDQIPTAEDIAKMPLLKAVIKETLRLYPVLPANARVAIEKDMVIDDYYFPKQTMFVLCHFAMSRDESNFPDPDHFLPQRWLRDGGMKHHPFSSFPFGYGVRACVGRRIAELEMHLALSRIVRMFEVRPDPKSEEVKHITRIVLTPDRPINLQFIERSPTHGIKEKH